MKKVFFLIIIILLFSCSDVSEFLFETEQSIEIRSIDNGFIFKEGEKLPLSILFHGNIIPESFSVVIFDDEGTSWGQTDVLIPFSEDEYNTALLIPEELPDGKYIFHIRVYEKEKEISFKEIIIFKTDGDYSIEQLISMPHETRAGKDVLIYADLTYPEDSDPFLRWMINGKILNEGFLSEGLDSLHLISEMKAGIYKINLYVFPEFCDTSMFSSVTTSTEIVVSDEPLPEADSFFPEDEYSLLFHFSGDSIPLDDENFTVITSGKITAESLDNKLVYSFSGNNGLSVSGSILPKLSGALTPFSINGRISPFDMFSGGNLLKFTSDDEDLFTISLNNSNHLVFEMGDQYSLSRFAISEMTEFSIQVIPSAKTLEIRWFYNGIEGGRDVLSNTFLQGTSVQTVVLGGSEDLESAQFLVDELGIYVGDKLNSKVDSSQFKRIKEYALRENLILAEGFDTIDGDHSIEPGERFSLYSFPLSIRETEVVLSLPAADKKNYWNLVFENSDGVILADLSQIYAFEEIDKKTGLITNKMRITLIFNEQSKVFEVKIGNEKQGVLNSFHVGDMLSLFLEVNAENKESTLLDYYIIFTNTDSIIQEMIMSSDDEEILL